MIRFKIVGGEYLDLPSDFKFSFSYHNTLFAFDKMQMSRSTEFQVPATPKNNLILNFALDPASDGGWVRTKKQAELHYSGGKIDGFLFFGKYSKGNYSAIFVYGELEALKTAREKGNIVEYCDFSESLPTVSPTFRSAYSSLGTLPYSFAWYNYKNGTADANRLVGAMNYSPSVKLYTLIVRAATRAGINVNLGFSATAINSIALILPTQKKASTQTSISFTGVPNSTLVVSGAAGYLQSVTKTFKYKQMDSFFWERQAVVCFECLQDMTLKINSVAYTESVHLVTGEGRDFISKGMFGVEAGEEYTFKKGDYFTFTNWIDYFFKQPISDYGRSIGTVTASVWGASQTEVGIGDTYHLQPNLPEVTLIDLLKTAANLLRMGIDYDVATNTVSFYNFAFDKSQAIELDSKTIEILSVDRTFLDYARKNIIDFKSEEYVKNRRQIVYNINNDLIAEEKTLYTIPFSEGNFDEQNNVVVQDFDAENKKTAKVATIGVVSKVSGQTYLKHVSEIPKNVVLNQNLSRIINESTTIVWMGRMTAGDFLKLKNKNTYKYKGQYYCCIDGTHTDGTATLTLVKI